MEQLQLGFSDSTQKPASDRIQKKWKKLDYNYNKYPIVKLAPKSAGQVISTLSYSIQLSTNKRKP